VPSETLRNGARNVICKSYLSPELSSLSPLSSASISALSALLLSLPTSLFSFWPGWLYLFPSPKLSKRLSLFPPPFQPENMTQFCFIWFLGGDAWQRQLSIIHFHHGVQTVATAGRWKFWVAKFVSCPATWAWSSSLLCCFGKCVFPIIMGLPAVLQSGIQEEE